MSGDLVRDIAEAAYRSQFAPDANGRRDPAGPLPLTDVGNAERLVARHGPDLRFVPGLGWHAWDGCRWRRDTDGEVTRRMIDTVRAIATEAAATDDDADRKKLLAHALRSEAEARIRAAVALAAADERIVVQPDDLDAHPLLLNIGNGILDLERGRLLEHDRERLLSRITPVDYDSDAQAPTWEAFLERILAGDRDLIAFMQRAVGYSLTASVREQVFFLLYGTGANGKTTLIETLQALLGEYARQTSAETFLERRETIPNDVAALRGARFVAGVETGEGRRLNETLVKRLVGGDTVAARFMRSEWFEFRPAFKCWVATNHKPVIRGTDEAIWRRIRLVPFTVTIPEDERDGDLGEKLLAELPGILRWAVDGCRAWQADGLGTPPAVTDATAGYRREMDMLGDFLDDACVLHPNAKVKAGDLYAAFVAWCEKHGERERLTQQAFGRRLTERGFEARRDGRARWWHGVGLAADGDGS